MSYDGILFDLDGTLWDSTKGVYASWASALEKIPEIKKIPTMAELESVMGMTDLHLMNTLFPYLDDKRAIEVFNFCCEEENTYLLRHGGVHYEGVKETLEALSKTHTLAIVSNCNLGYIECYMDSMGTRAYITDFECFGNTRRPKGENIRLVAERNGLKNPVYVGDTHWDMEAAALAGVPFIYASYGFGNIPNAEKSIARFEELLGMV